MQTTLTYSTARDVIQSAQESIIFIGVALLALFLALQAVALLFDGGFIGKTDWTSVIGCLVAFAVVMTWLLKRVAA